MNTSRFYLLLRIILGTIFLFSAFGKLLSLQIFKDNINSLLSLEPHNFFTPVFSIVYPVFEIILAILFFINYKPKTVTLVGVLVVIIFLFVNVYKELIIGSNQSCGCFGDLVSTSSLQSIIVDLIMMFILLANSAILNKSQQVKYEI